MLLYSFSLSVKMSALFILPGYLFVLVCREGPIKGIIISLFIVLSQIIIGLPFIITNSSSYFNNAYEFKRILI